MTQKSTKPEAGISLLEVGFAIAILAILAVVAIPTAQIMNRRVKEVELRHDLRAMRRAIDEYHRYAVQGLIQQTDVAQDFYPPDLETLVDGVVLAGDPTGKKIRFLRRIPVDPMTGSKDWGLRSTRDDPDSDSWGGENVYDVYCPSTALALDGKTHYNEW
ncbi:MAG: type II secretion system protein [Acidobacteriota bacterium]|jgi:general secretion pathway protein G